MHASPPYLYRSEFVKSVSYTESSEDPGPLWAQLNSLKNLSPGTNVLWIYLETAPNIVPQS